MFIPYLELLNYSKYIFRQLNWADLKLGKWEQIYKAFFSFFNQDQNESEKIYNMQLSIMITKTRGGLHQSIQVNLKW